VIAEWLNQAATKRPDHCALRVLGSGDFLTFSQLKTAVDGAALALRQAGLCAGQAVPLAMERTLAAVVQILAVISVNAVPVLGGTSALSKQGVARSKGALVVVYTSGSTGNPIPIPLSITQIRASVAGSAERLGVDPSDAWLCVLPLNHVGGLSIVFRGICAGTTVVLGPESFQPQVVAEALQRGEVTQVSLVPTQLQRLMPFFELRPPALSLRFILLGGGAASVGLLSACEGLGLPVARTWGMTECASQIATAFPGVLSGPVPTLSGVEVVRDPATGRLRVSGDIAPGGSFLTRDLGQVSDKGVLLDGRVDDIVISGGENLSLVRIQSALEKHPLIVEAAVVVRPDSMWGERPVAICVCKNGLRPTVESVGVFLLEQGLRAREIPDSLQWVDSLPRNELGKLIKGLLPWE
jgi:O-succinylbenzoic acid--CoA ligase